MDAALPSVLQSEFDAESQQVYEFVYLMNGLKENYVNRMFVLDVIPFTT